MCLDTLAKMCMCMGGSLYRKTPDQPPQRPLLTFCSNWLKWGWLRPSPQACSLWSHRAWAWCTTPCMTDSSSRCQCRCCSRSHRHRHSRSRSHRHCHSCRSIEAAQRGKTPCVGKPEPIEIYRNIYIYIYINTEIYRNMCIYIYIVKTGGRELKCMKTRRICS